MLFSLQSIQFWYSPFVQSLFFCFYYPSFHLSSPLYKESYGNKFLYPSFSPELIMRSAMLPCAPFSIKFYCIRKKKRKVGSIVKKLLHFWHCNPILLQLMALHAAIWFANLGMCTGIWYSLRGLTYSFGRMPLFLKIAFISLNKFAPEYMTYS